MRILAPLWEMSCDDDLPKDRRHDRSGKEQTEGFRVDMALLSVGSSPIQRDGAGLAR